MNKIPGVGWLVSKLTSGVSGPIGWFLGVFFESLFGWLAKKGIYVIDTSVAGLRTNMDADTFTRVMGDGWEQTEAGVSAEKGKAIDEGVKRAFSKFVAFKVKDNYKPK